MIAESSLVEEPKAYLIQNVFKDAHGCFVLFSAAYFKSVDGCFDGHVNDDTVHVRLSKQLMDHDSR